MKFDHAKAMAELAEGDTCAAVGRRHHVTRERIRQLALKHKVIYPTKLSEVYKRNALIVAELKRNKKTRLEIAEDFGIDGATVGSIAAEAGLDGYEMNRERREAPLGPLIDRVAKGESFRQVADLDHALAEKIRRAATRKGVKSKHGPRGHDYTKRRAIITKGLAQGWTRQQIADKVTAAEGHPLTLAALSQYIYYNQLKPTGGD
jgi:hypothetical protein